MALRGKGLLAALSETNRDESRSGISAREAWKAHLVASTVSESVSKKISLLAGSLPIQAIDAPVIRDNVLASDGRA